MKCPCCESVVNTPFLVYRNQLIFSNGRVVSGSPAELEIFKQLTKGPIHSPVDKRSNTFHVHISRLRVLFLEEKLPYEILSDHGTYTLLGISSHEQNDNDAERQKDVHS